MGFLDKVVKSVETGVGRAQFETDKLMKVNTLRSEVERAKHDRRSLLVEIGEEAVTLYASHEINLPGLDMQLARLSDLTQMLKSKEEQLAAAEATQFIAPAPATPAPAPVAAPAPAIEPVVEPTPAAAAPVAPAARPTFCPNCGTKLPAVGVFCPACGTKI